MLLVVIFDPTLYVLLQSIATLGFAALLHLVWRRRQDVLTWHQEMHPIARGLTLGLLLWAGVAGWFALVQWDGLWFTEFARTFLPLELATTCCAILAWPIAAGGWFLIWGDNGLPESALNGVLANVAAGIALNTLLAVLFSFCIGQIRLWENSTANRESLPKID